MSDGTEHGVYEGFEEIHLSHTKFKSYEVIIGKWRDKERTNIAIKHEEVVAAPNTSVVRKYMEKLAKNKVPPPARKWKWNGNVYEQKDGKYYVTYEHIDSDTINRILI